MIVPLPHTGHVCPDMSSVVAADVCAVAVLAVVDFGAAVALAVLAVGAFGSVAVFVAAVFFCDGFLLGFFFKSSSVVMAT